MPAGPIVPRMANPDLGRTPLSERAESIDIGDAILAELVQANELARENRAVLLNLVEQFAAVRAMLEAQQPLLDAVASRMARRRRGTGWNPNG